jgi:nucleotide-binding universal stress UspA family protein
MVVHGPERCARGIVLAAIDLAERAGEVLNFAFAEARIRSAQLRAITAVETTKLRTLVGAGGGPEPEPHPTTLTDTQTELDQLLAERQTRCTRVQANGQALHGPPTRILTTAATHADIVITGARRRDDTRHGVNLGAVTQALLRHTTCPVIVVPHL